MVSRRELLDGGLQVIDSRDDRLHGLDFALVLGAKNPGQDGVNHREVSLQREIRYFYSSAGGTGSGPGLVYYMPERQPA